MLTLLLDYKAKASIKVLKVFTYDYSLKDQLIQLGTGRGGTPILTLRLVEIRVGKADLAYITSAIDPNVLPPYVVADLYRRRWRIEEAFHTVKRLLNCLICGLVLLTVSNYRYGLLGYFMRFWLTWGTRSPINYPFHLIAFL